MWSYVACYSFTKKCNQNPEELLRLKRSNIAAMDVSRLELPPILHVSSRTRWSSSLDGNCCWGCICWLLASNLFIKMCCCSRCKISKNAVEVMGCWARCCSVLELCEKSTPVVDAAVSKKATFLPGCTPMSADRASPTLCGWGCAAMEAYIPTFSWGKWWNDGWILFKTEDVVIGSYWPPAAYSPWLLPGFWLISLWAAASRSLRSAIASFDFLALYCFFSSRNSL